MFRGRGFYRANVVEVYCISLEEQGKGCGGLQALTDLQGVHRRSGRVQDVASEFGSDSHG